MEVPLNGVTRVVEEEDDGLQPEPHHRRDLLDGELNGTVADEEQRTAEVLVTGSKGSAESGAYRSQKPNIVSKIPDEGSTIGEVGEEV